MPPLHATAKHLTPWSAIDADTRLIALHEINTAITRLRERSGLEPINDALPHERPNVFILVKEALFPREREAPPDARNPVREQWRLMSNEVTKKKATEVDGFEGYEDATEGAEERGGGQVI